MKKVMVAMSGGVDSSACAALLQEQGYEVIGATLRIWKDEECGREKEKSCCSLRDVEDAKKCAHVLGIKHYVFNVSDLFHEHVISYFFEEYKNGRTPNPCVICNEYMKFEYMLKKAIAVDCDYVATGHYAQITRDEKGAHLLKGVDHTKDQSYALFGLTQETMKHVLFPLGGYKKTEIRELAKKYELPTFEKRDSQELCFIPDNDTRGYIAKHLPEYAQEGPIVDVNGKKLGTHLGVCFYTIGQRNGLGAFGKPMYVTKIIPEINTIVIGERDDLLKSSLTVERVNWTNPLYNVGANNHSPLQEAHVQIRYKHDGAPAKVTIKDESTLAIEFQEPQRSITPGQVAVVYIGDEVIAGGWIV